MPAIVAENLAKSYRVFQKQEGLWGSLRSLYHREYRLVHAARDVSFSIERGEMVAFLGPNGAGKTTTLKLLSGLLYPTTGQCRVLGYVPQERQHAFRRRFSLVMGQKNQLWWDLPAIDSFRLHQEIYCIPPADYRRRLDELVGLLDVEHKLHQPVRELSLGERMRMELIAALLHEPEVLFLDEPTIGLDVVSQTTVQKFLRHYQRTQGITVLLTSHYMKDVEALCERAIIINEGEIKHDGALSDVVSRFSQDKLVSLQFAGGLVPPDLASYGEVIEASPTRTKLRIKRLEIPKALASLLERYPVEDVAVLERPLEDVIAEMFREVRTQGREQPSELATAGAVR